MANPVICELKLKMMVTGNSLIKYLQNQSSNEKIKNEGKRKALIVEYQLIMNGGI